MDNACNILELALCRLVFTLMKDEKAASVRPPLRCVTLQGQQSANEIVFMTFDFLQGWA